MAKRGRKTKYTPETVGKIVQAIKLGATYKLACGYAGISHDTFYTWMSTKPEFSETIKEAEGAGAVELLARIKKEAAEGTWQAAAWILERRHPEDYGRQRYDVSHTFDWQKELTDLGVDAGEIFDQLVQSIADQSSGDATDD